MNKLFFLVILISCSNAKIINKEKKLVKKSPPAFQYQIQDIAIFNGKVKFIQFETDLKNGLYKLRCEQELQEVVKDLNSDEKTKPKKKITDHAFNVENKKVNLYLAESYFSKPHFKKCFIRDSHVLNVTVNSYNYKRERLNVPKKYTNFSKKNLERIIREKEIKKKIYLESSEYFLFQQQFKVPLKSKITSYYGNQRVFNDEKTSQHLGWDLRARTGVPIPSTNRGRVIFTGDLFFSGNMVVIDHGLDIFTVYMHLSKIMVQEGTIVNQGDIVGKAGMTGRVSGPHLHWGVRINGNWVDGFSLVNESKKHIINNELEK